MPPSPWIYALAGCLIGALAVVAYWAFRVRTPRRPAPLPSEWSLSARPVFNTDERRIYRLLREALPHHVVLAKLPLVRFCQPADPNEVRYWFDLLGSIHVAFAVCSANGRVLAAIDLENDRGGARRPTQIKQQVMAACRVRYLRCAPGNLPSIAELQLLVPQNGATPRGPQALPTAAQALSSTLAHRRAERTALWQDSSVFQDSFFALDSRLDGIGSTDFGGLGPSSGPGRLYSDRDERARGEDIVGVVVDDPEPAVKRRG